MLCLNPNSRSRGGAGQYFKVVEAAFPLSNGLLKRLRVRAVSELEIVSCSMAAEPSHVRRSHTCHPDL